MKTSTVGLPIASLKPLSVEYASMIADHAMRLDYTHPDYVQHVEQFEKLTHDFLEIHKALIKTIAEEASNVPQLVASTPKE